MGTFIYKVGKNTSTPWTVREGQGQTFLKLNYVIYGLPLVAINKFDSYLKHLIYSGDLISGLVQILNGQKEIGLQMV